jgi:hypothetical protein
VDNLTAEDVKKMLYAGMAKKPANVWPTYGSDKSLDRTKYVTSSEIGYCERKVYFDKALLSRSDYSPEQGTTQVAKGWGMMERGHVIEAWFIDTLTRAIEGARLILAGLYQRSFADRHQSGTPDGVFLLNDGRFKTLEVKSIDPRTNVGKLPKKEHIKQITQNCDLVELALDKTCEGTLLVYIDASDYERIFPFDIPFDRVLAEQLEARAGRILNAASAAALEPEGVHLGHCGYCRHTTECNALVRKPVKEDTRNAIANASSKLFGQLP